MMMDVNWTFVDDDINERIENFLDTEYAGILTTKGSDWYEGRKIDSEIHRDRIRFSVQCIYEAIKRESPKNIFVAGDRTNIDECLEELGAYEGIDVVFTDFELRDRFPFEDKTFDLIINFEVFEHIKDTSDSPTQEFAFTGARSFIKETYRILKPGGKMLLSTPNACSIKAACRILMHNHPFFYFRHVREYAPYELKAILEQSGYEIEHFETYDVWSELNGKLSYIDVNWLENKAIMEPILANSPYPKHLRGDDIFTIAVRKFQ
jgi:SAM-dependent methyltransferase